MAMVNVELFSAFLLASALLVLFPGPVVSLVIANSLKHGTAYGVTTSLGANAGTIILFVAGAIGLTTALVFMADLFDIVRWLGAAYLIYLGIKEWRSTAAVLQDAQANRRKSFKRTFVHGFLTGLTNPKTMVFYIAFFPQFIDVTLPPAPQIAIMTASFIGLAIVLDGSYALLAGRIRPYLMDAKRAVLRARMTGSLLIATGIGLALARRDA
jgi:threonine/homoserine/homoserine lactone efflux protein